MSKQVRDNNSQKPHVICPTSSNCDVFHGFITKFPLLNEQIAKFFTQHLYEYTDSSIREHRINLDLNRFRTLNLRSVE